MSATSEIFANSASSVAIPATSDRRRRYQEGSLVAERRKECSHDRRTRCPYCVWAYRFFEYVDGKKIRRKAILGTVDQFPTKDDAKRACEHYRMYANAEVPRPNTTIRGLIDLYTERILKPCMNVPIGGTQDPNEPMGYKCASSYLGQLRNRISGRWGGYSVADFERPEIWWSVQEWLKSLVRSPKNPSGFAPKTVRLVFATMGQLAKYAVKWGYLSQNPFAGKEGQERRIDPPRGSTLRLTKANQLTPEQSLWLISHLSLRENVAVTLSAWLGPRGSEIFGLKWMDLDLTAAVVTFRRGVDAGRITPGKTTSSNTEMPLPKEVVQVLRLWHSATPYNKPEDWIFASWQKKGKNPVYPQCLMDHIQRVARKLGLPHVTWYSFRHSLNALAKECLPREERRIMLRHGNTATEEGYGEVPLERKREIAQRLWTRMRERLGGDMIPNLLGGTTGDGAPELEVDANHSPATEPSSGRTALECSVEQNPQQMLARLEHERRSAVARKAWVTIRANRAKKAPATAGSDPDLTLSTKAEIA